MELIKEPKDYEELIEMAFQHLQYCGDDWCDDDNCEQCHFKSSKPECVAALMAFVLEIMTAMRKDNYTLIEYNKSLKQNIKDLEQELSIKRAKENFNTKYQCSFYKGSGKPWY